MRGEISHPSDVNAEASSRLPQEAREALSDALERAELRPSMAGDYAKETLRAYRKRFAHYATWCAEHGYQPHAESITADTVQSYILAQIKLAELRPNVLIQALTALTWYGERVTGQAPDVRQARQAVYAYKAKERAENIPPAFTVGRVIKRPKPARRTGTA